MKYQQPWGVSDPEAPYVNGLVKDGIDGSIPPAPAFEQPMRELVALITQGGFAPSNDDLDQVPKGIRSGLYNYFNDTGAVNAMVVTPAPPLEAYNDGLPIRVKVGNTNTGPTTLNVSGLGAVLVVKANGSTLAAGDLVGGQVVDLIYDGVNFQIVNFMGLTTGTTTNNFLSLTLPYVADSSPTPNILIGLYTPTITSLVEGLFISIKIANPINGPTVITVNSNSPKPVVHGDGTPLGSGQAAPGQVLLLIYDGANFQLSGGGYAPADVVETALFPHAIFKEASPFAPQGGVAMGIGPWLPGVGDPTITAAFNLSNGTFTVPAGLGGLWLITGYLYHADINFYTPAGIQDHSWVNGGDLQLHNLTTSDMFASSLASVTHKHHMLEAGLTAFVNLSDGQQVQMQYVAGATGASYKKFGFTAIRFGRT